jgi:hypothetical protein
MNIIKPIGMGTTLMYLDKISSSDCKDIVDILDNSLDMICNAEILDDMKNETGMFDLTPKNPWKYTTES